MFKGAPIQKTLFVWSYLNWLSYSQFKDILLVGIIEKWFWCSVLSVRKPDSHLTNFFYDIHKAASFSETVTKHNIRYLLYFA